MKHYDVNLFLKASVYLSAVPANSAQEAYKKAQSVVDLASHLERALPVPTSSAGSVGVSGLAVTAMEPVAGRLAELDAELLLIEGSEQTFGPTGEEYFAPIAPAGAEPCAEFLAEVYTAGSLVALGEAFGATVVAHLLGMAHAISVGKPYELASFEEERQLEKFLTRLPSWKRWAPLIWPLPF